MPRKMKAYLPQWILWIMMPMIVVIWGFITYSVFATDSGRQEIGIVGWLLLSVVFVLIAIMFWLMASGRLPAYVIEIQDDDDHSKL